jgi:diguanylate cyclase (GGDEF)-like protein
MTNLAVEATAGDRRMARAAHIVCVVGLVWVALLTAGALGPYSDITYPILGTGAIVCAVVGVRRNRPALSWPWWVIGASLALLVVGGSVRESMGVVGNLTSSRSPIPDLITIPGYLILGVGLVGIVHARRRGRSEVDVLLDGLVAALAALALAWIFLVNPALYHDHAPLTVRLALTCYPPLSIFFLALAAGLAFSGGTSRPFSYDLLLGSMVFMVLGDVVFMLLEIGVVDSGSHLTDAPYALAFVAFMGAVLHPSMRELTEPVATEATGPRNARLALVAIALAIPGLITVTRSDAPAGDRIALGMIVMSLTAAAIWRMFRALRGHAISEAELAHQATHDTLTDLPNRRAVHEHLASMLDDLPNGKGVVAVLFLDVDRFKLVNDTHGHGMGDELLLAVARRLCACTRPEDLVARIGGDEFVVVVRGLAGATEALEVAERTRLAFAVPFEVRGSEIASTTSIGVSIADGLDPDTDAESLIRDADTAMYQAKEAGRDAVAVFDPSMRDRAAQRLELERDLRHALARNELSVHYQPVVRLPNGEVKGFEALLRWSHPTRGQVPPMSFIPVAEETGLIVEIGAWVLDQAARQVARWRAELEGGENLFVAVNISARQLRDESLIETVHQVLLRNGLPAGALHLELTESLLMEKPTAAAELLNRLRTVGVKLAIDDFGTGYSSLAYLQRFSVDVVKIDRSFVDGVEAPDSSEESLVAAIVAMAGALHVTTVAEGVETEVQAHRLHDLGCDVAQGFLYSRPLAADQVPATVARLGTSPRLLRAVQTESA